MVASKPRGKWQMLNPYRDYGANAPKHTYASRITEMNDSLQAGGKWQMLKPYRDYGANAP